ncbi:DNA (cytosine-5-)-methyltransferase [Qipengyuania aquimaris]|uniref:DNA (cytosine-5-)-methyltransferase n=1 Tax=Qipengyuania aquimaris TaxID=255984 RepID=UPI001FD3E645|nr:DNA (cytosine-5-)-methyltransferase [Qipengyuania aquimaris]UOR15827.1 DNA (cytosine-5-)-methyltransferase [Qipengyuania aquimaris]
MEFGTVVREKRENLGLSQKEFSDLLGLSEGGERTVRGWELGEHDPAPARKAQITSLPDSAPFANSGGKDFRFIDLFAGIGGIRLGFEEAGGSCVFTSEWDKFSKKTYAANFGEVPDGDITQISATDIPDHDVLLAGFPCQAFSRAGLRKGFQDTRGTMFFEIQRILAEKRPAAFLLENVKQLRGHDSGRTLQTILDILNGNTQTEIPEDVPMSEQARASLGIPLDYETGYAVLTATDFGVPQKRERIYIVGFSRSAFPEIEMQGFFDELPGQKKSPLLGAVLENNKDVPENYTISDRLHQGHIRRRLEHARKGNGFGFSVFNRQSPYCNTISARYYKDGSEVLIDQSDIGRNPRKLTPRECARIQGFPEDFVVDAVSSSQAYRQFGNSVSVPVIVSLAKRMNEWVGGRLGG